LGQEEDVAAPSKAERNDACTSYSFVVLPQLAIYPPTRTRNTYRTRNAGFVPEREWYVESSARREPGATVLLGPDVVVVHTLLFASHSNETLQTTMTDVACALRKRIASHFEYVWDDDRQRSLQIAGMFLVGRTL
jgi:hypothetical protein